MAFRRKKSGFKKALARKANFRYDHFPSVDISSCGPLATVANDCPGEEEDPPPGQRIVLLDNSAAELQFNDSVTVVGMYGLLKFVPTYDLSAGTNDITEWALRSIAGYHFMGGVRRIEQNVGGFGNATVDSPIANPVFFQDDWSDIHWVKRFERMRTNIEHTDFATASEMGGKIAGVCADTTAAGAGAPANTLSSGSGTINIPAINTSCSVLAADPPNAGDAINTSELWNVTKDGNRGFTLNFRSKKRVKITGKQALVFDFSYAPVNIAFPVTSPPVGFIIFGKVFLTLRV